MDVSIRQARQERHQYGIGLTYSSCVPLLDVVPPTRHECVDITDAAIDYLVRSPIDRIAIAGYWTDAAETVTTLRHDPRDPTHSLFYTGLDRTLARLTSAGKKIYLLRDVPELATNRTPYTNVIQSLREGGSPVYGPSLPEHRSRQRAVDADIDSLQRKYNFTVLDPAPWLCSNDGWMQSTAGPCIAINTT
ncbi:SGNH hydrolase domain-containing protein [Achromobacter insuavis]